MIGVLIFAGVLAAVLLWGLAIWFVIRTVFVVLSGWNRLAERYLAPAPPPGWQWSGQTVKVGAVRYRSCMRVSAMPDGVYLAEAGLMRHPALRIPWPDLHSPYSTSVYGRSYVGVNVGRPSLGTVEFPYELYTAMYAAATRGWAGVS